MAGRSFVSRFIFFVNLVFAFGLGLTYVSVFISPSILWPAGFIGLAYPVLVVVNVLFVLWWLIRRPRYALLSLLVLAAGLNLHLRYFSWHPADRLTLDSAPENSFRLLSYNVRIFNKNEPDARFEGRDEMIEMMKNSGAEVICLQEFYTSKRSPSSNHLQRISEATGLHHMRLQASLKDLNDRWGLVIFSRFPIVDAAGIDFEQGGVLNDAVFTDLNIDGDTLRIYNVHLQSINLTDRDLDFVDPVAGLDHSSSGRQVMGKFRRAFSARAAQVDSLARHIDSSPYPVILCGDFNDTPVSYAYHCLSRGMNDAFVKAGTGFGRTHANMPFLRIDYVLTDPEISVQTYGTIREDNSDHYPVVVDLAIHTDDATGEDS